MKCTWPHSKAMQCYSQSTQHKPFPITVASNPAKEYAKAYEQQNAQKWEFPLHSINPQIGDGRFSATARWAYKCLQNASHMYYISSRWMPLTPPSPHYAGAVSAMECSESCTKSPWTWMLQQCRSEQKHFREGCKASCSHYLAQAGQLILASEANAFLNIYCLCTREEGEIAL